MKLLHCADLHLGSKLNSVFDRDPDKSKLRRDEILNSFAYLIDYAGQNGVDVILLAGDVFDSDRPTKADKDYFYDTIAENGDIDFLYLRGNHDKKGAYDLAEKPQNLHLFSDEWTVFERGNVCVYGVELTDENYVSIYSALKCDPQKFNIVTLHGQTAASPDKNAICLKALQHKGIDYLALGHVHTFEKNRLDERGVYAYCGCPEGRGFDECGEKGFVVLDTDRGVESVRFVRAAKRIMHDVTLDIGGCQNAVQAEKMIAEATAFPNADIVRLTLTGEVGFDTVGFETRAQELLSRRFYYVEVRDKTASPIDYAQIATELSRRGEFVRAVLEDDSLSDDRKKQIIRLGLALFAGGDPV